MSRKQIFVYIDEFAINGIQPKFLLLTGKFRRGVTERVRLKEYSQAVNIQFFSGCA